MPYCSKKCQGEDWNFHKQYCAACASAYNAHKLGEEEDKLVFSIVLSAKVNNTNIIFHEVDISDDLPELE